MVAIVAIVVVGLIALMAARMFRDREGTTVTRDTVSNPLPDGPLQNPRLPQNQGGVDLAIPAAGVQPASTTLANLTQDSTRYYGQNVEIQGVVRRIISPTAFTISSGADSGDEVLVVNAMTTNPPTQEQGKRVRVAGQFKAYDQGQIQETLGDRFEQNQFTDFSTKPMIMATRVQPAGDVAP